MAKKNEWIKIGKLGAAHKLSGEIKLHFDDSITPIKLTSILVGKSLESALPFMIQDIKNFTNNTLIVLLDEIKNREAAMKLSGIPVWMKESDIEKSETIVDEKIIGYKIIDSKMGAIGAVKDVYQMPAQTILVFDYQSNEILLPCNPESIIKIHHRKKEIDIAIPDGLLEVYCL
jgi:16S rRNA processing protein RimM